MEEDNRGVLVFAAHSFLGSRIIKDYKMTQILKLPKLLNRSFGRSSAAFPFEGVRGWNNLVSAGSLLSALCYLSSVICSLLSVFLISDLYLIFSQPSHSL